MTSITLEDLDQLVQLVPDALLVANKKGKIVWGNAQLSSLLGYEINELIGASIEKLVPTDMREQHVQLRNHFINTPSKKIMSNNPSLLAQTKKGELVPIYAELNHILWKGEQCSLAILRSRTQDVEQKQKLQYLAHYDQLTNLPNRTLFLTSLKKSLEKAKERSEEVAILYLDLDGFKEINDTQGHDAGDVLLQEIANRLRLHTPANTIAARLGGDEFAILQTHTNKQDSQVLAKELLKQLYITKRFVNHTLDISASIGIARYPNDGHDMKELLRKADQAMYQAKKKGRNRYQHYDSEEGKRHSSKIQMISDLNEAINNKAFEIHYQPKLDLTNNGFINVEALLRWNHPQKGNISPANFIPIAEESGQILSIGEQSFKQVCQFIYQWNLENNQCIKVAVNLSARQLRTKNIAKELLKIMDQSGIKGHSLEFEITESVVMHDVEASLTILEHLKSTGATIAIDDFGTGYSSLSYLKKLPVNTLKIDQSFVFNLPNDQNDCAIVKAIISMAHDLGIQVVAEGVETERQLDFLVSLGCEQLQGYYIGRPCPTKQLPKFLQHMNQLKQPIQEIQKISQLFY